MKVIIKAQSSVRAKNGEGRLRITIDGVYREIKAVVFSRAQSAALLTAADNAHIVIEKKSNGMK